MILRQFACSLLILAFVVTATSTYAAAPPKIAAYVHVVTTANTCGTSTVISHPLANGNPNAVIQVTYNAGQTSDQSQIFYPGGPLAIYYDDAGLCGTAATGHWEIYGLENQSQPFVVGQRFNITIAAP